MPFLRMSVSANKSEELSENIVNMLKKHTSETLGKNPDVTSIVIDYISPKEWFIGGKKVKETGKSTFNLEILITEGTNNKSEKSEYIKQVFSDMEKILGTLTPACYIFINEIKADSWGFQGATQEFRYINGKFV